MSPAVPYKPMRAIATTTGNHGNIRLSRSERLSQPWWLAIFTGLITLLIAMWGCFFVLRDSRRTAYHGKALTLWLQTYTSSARGSAEWKETDEAVRHIGTNALPVLLHLIHAKDSPLKLRLVALARKQKLMRIHFVAAAERNIQASRAFIVLGDTAKGAVPELVKMFEENLSADSLSALEDALTWIGPAAKPAIPVLLRTATNSNSKVRANALWALGEIHAEPQLCVPALIQGLNDSDSWARVSAAHALGMFGTDAQPAILALTELTKFPSVLQGSITMVVQEGLEARNALRKIGVTTNVPPNEPIPSFGTPTPDWPFPPQ
jgi:hypothetical protein